MKNLEKLAEVACSAEQVFLPNRYQEPFMEAFQQLTGLEIPRMKSRKMKEVSNGQTYRLARGRDIPLVVETVSKADPKTRTIGLTGTEWCAEYALGEPESNLKWDRITEKKLGRVALIAPYGSNIDLIRARLERGFYPLEVATVYPNVVGAEGLSGRSNITPVLQLSGALEGVAPALGIPVVDLVSSGATVEENDFIVVEKLFDVYPSLVSLTAEENKIC